MIACTQTGTFLFCCRAFEVRSGWLVDTVGSIAAGGAVVTGGMREILFWNFLPFKHQTFTR